LIISPSKSVNIVCKLLQLLGDFVPQTPSWDFAPGLLWGTSVPQTPPAVAPQMKVPGAATELLVYSILLSFKVSSL